MTFTKGDWRGERRDAPSLPEILHALSERRLLVAGVVLTLAGAALFLGLYRAPVYPAEAVVGIRYQEDVGDDEARAVLVREVQFAVASDGGEKELRREAMRRASWSAGAREFGERLDVRPSAAGDGSELVVRFVGREPEEAARAANAYAAVFAREVERLAGERLAEGALIAEAGVQRPAVPVEERRGARPLLYAAAAAGAGLLLGGAAAMLLEGRVRGWRGVHDAELTLRAPVLGAIPDYSPDARAERGDAS